MIRLRRRHAVVVFAFLAAPIALIACAPRVVTRSAAAIFPGCRYEHAATDSSPRMVALTIDDSPDSTTTAAILDTLRAYGAHATFFVITGHLASAPDPLVERILREGHEIGHHGTRDRAAVLLDSAAFEHDLLEADSVLREHGADMARRWARPGSGWYSPRMIRAMRRAGYECALGSIYPLDAAQASMRLSRNYILSHVRPGAIVILHDRGERGKRTAAVLGRVLPQLRARGYHVVTLSELIPRITPTS